MTLDISSATCINVDAATASAASSDSFSKTLRISPKYGSSTCAFALSYLDSDPRDGDVIVVQGGISADHHAPQWWHELVGIGKAIDPSHHRVLSIDWLDAQILGACRTYGIESENATARGQILDGSPVDSGSIDQESARIWTAQTDLQPILHKSDRLPSAIAVSSEDQADALAALLDSLGIGRIAAFVGASYGGMVGLAFAARHGARLDQLLVLAAAHRPHPLATAQRAVQRGIVRLGLQQGCVDQALSLARQLAMTTYRGHTELGKRFAGGAELLDGRLRLPVEDWLEHAGARFATRFDAQRYLALSESIDLHDVDPAAIHCPTTLIGFTSDRLVPLSDLCELQQRLGRGATLEVIETIYGHDGFLKQCDALTPLLRAALNTPLQHTPSPISRSTSCA